jgi:histone H2A
MDKKKATTSKQTKAGLTFAVSRVDKKLRQAKISKQVASNASIFLTGVVEHVIMKALENAGDQAGMSKSKRLTDAHIVAAVRSDPDLARVFSGFCFSSRENVPKAIDKILPEDEQKLRKQRKLEAAQRKKEAAQEIAD